MSNKFQMTPPTLNQLFWVIWTIQTNSTSSSPSSLNLLTTAPKKDDKIKIILAMAVGLKNFKSKQHLHPKYYQISIFGLKSCNVAYLKSKFPPINGTPHQTLWCWKQRLDQMWENNYPRSNNWTRQKIIHYLEKILYLMLLPLNFLKKNFRLF